MKISRLLSVAALSFITGSILSYGGNSEVWQYVASSTTLALALCSGLTLVAYHDYMRKPRSITLPISRLPCVLHPAIPVANSNAYRIRRQRALIERAAA